MKLLTDELIEQFKKYPIGSQEELGMDAKILVKYFNPCGSGTWLITEAEKQSNDWLLWGYCNIFEWEWGYVSLKELENVKLPFDLHIERDIYTNLSTVNNYILNK